MNASVEREVKLEPAPEFDLGSLHGSGALDRYALSRPTLERLHTIYYDTADLRLARLGFNLRYRWGDEGWTLKVPMSRDEMGATRQELRFDGEPGTPPAAAVALIRGIVRHREIVPVVELRTLRRHATVEGVAEIDCDDVSVVRSGRVVANFRQTEIEALESADEASFDDVVDRLRSLGAGKPAWEPKLERALGITTEPPTTLGDDEPACALVTLALDLRLADLLRNDFLIRLRAEAEDVHKARSSVRKLRAILRGFRSFLDRAWADTLREELRWLAGELGNVRDIDVALNQLHSRAASVPTADAPFVEKTLEPLRDARAEGLKRLRVSLEGERYLALIDAVEKASHEPQFGESPPRTAGELARGTLKKASNRVRKAVRRARGSVALNELHHARIQVRNGRYAAEACASVVGKRAKQLAKRLSRMQDILGAIHDAAFVQDRLRATVGEARTPLVAGELLALEAVEGEKARDVWKSVRRRALKADWTEV
ncbi:MAG: CHAD domain-containing protein [Candidatus Eremiobacteraeota bacterium]|nr:CHAD domain-containing protein [Candidatus Eremiobacteraeota bacterium]